MHKDPHAAPEALLAPSLRDILYVLFTHKWKASAFFVIVVAAVTAYTLTSRPEYLSEAKLLVRLGRESVTLDPTATTGQVVNVSRSQESELNSELEILRSPEMPRRIVETLGANRFAPAQSEDDGAKSLVADVREVLIGLGLLTRQNALDEAAGRVARNLHIEGVKLSNVIALSYEDHDPQLAQDVLSTLIELFLAKHIEVHKTSGSLELFASQAERLRVQIAEIEGELEKPAVGTELALTAERRTTLRDRLATLERALETATADIAASRAKQAALQGLLDEVPEVHVTAESTGQSNPATDAIRAIVYELRFKEQDVLSKYAENTPPVQQVREQLAQAEVLLQEEQSTRKTVTTGVNPAYQKIQLDLMAERAALRSTEAEREILVIQLEAARAECAEADAAYEASVRAQREDEIRVARLQRELDLREANYRRYTESLEQARIDGAMQDEKISNIGVYQTATLPVLPTGPGKVFNLVLGLLIAILGGVAVAFLAEFLDHSIKRPEEARRRLELPCLASVPRLVRRKRGTIPARSPACVASYAELADQVRCQANGASNRPLVIAVTSSRRGEGVSTVAANLAAALARSGYGRTILVDADYRNPTVDRLFNIRATDGVTDLLSNRPVRIRPSPIPNLRLLLAGSSGESGSVVLRPARYRAILDSLRKRYRFIVIDSPAVGESTSAAQIAALSDGVVFVVESGRVRWEVAQAAKNRLGDSKARILGVVLNKRSYPVPRLVYSAF